MNRRLVAILIAAALGLVGTIVVYLYVAQADSRALAGKASESVLVAARAIPAGTSSGDLLSGGYLQSEVMPTANVPADTVGSVQMLPQGSVLQTGLLKGELIRGTLFAAKGSLSTLAIPSGMIAVTVSLGDPQRVGGYVQPGTKVVVFATLSTTDGKGGASVQGTRTLMTDIQVLASGSSGSSSSTVGGASSGSSGQLVTLAITQSQADKLIFASQSGGLYLGLETDSSNLSTSDPGVTSVTLFN